MQSANQGNAMLDGLSERKERILKAVVEVHPERQAGGV